MKEDNDHNQANLHTRITHNNQNSNDVPFSYSQQPNVNPFTISNNTNAPGM